jgi:hypothetical protein
MNMRSIGILRIMNACMFMAGAMLMGGAVAIAADKACG